MQRTKWSRILWSGLSAGVLALGAIGADNPAQVVVLREPGKPEQRCVIEYSLPQLDGKTAYYVRDLATGERLRVIDNRPGAASPAGGQTKSWARPSDAGMAQALAASPAQDAPAKRRPTSAELAGWSIKTDAPPAPSKFRRVPPVKAAPTEDEAAPLPLSILQSGAEASQRESAALTLATGPAHARPEVVKALTSAAKDDPAASVRATCVRCLYKLSAEMPEVIPVLGELRNDANPEVARTAEKAMQEISKRVEARARQ